MSLDRFLAEYDSFDFGDDDLSFAETGCAVGPMPNTGSFDMAGTGGLVGKPNKLHESEPHDVSGESRDKSGKWTSGGGSTAGGGSGPQHEPKTEAQVISELASHLAHDGGFTYQPAMEDSPKTGFDVSISKEHERVFKGHEIDAKAIQDYMDERKDLFENDPTAHFGAWYDAEADKVYLDVSHIFQDKDQAIKLAQQHGQEGIYDLGAGKTIIVKRPEERRIGTPESAPCDAAGFSSGSDGGANPRGYSEAAPRGGPHTIAESAPDLRAAIAAAAASGYETICGDSPSQMVYVIVPIDGSNS